MQNRRATLGIGNSRHTTLEILEARFEGIYTDTDINNLYVGCPELYEIFGGEAAYTKKNKIHKTYSMCEKYVGSNKNIDPYLRKYLMDIISFKEWTNIYIGLCNAFFIFYESNLLYDNDVSVTGIDINYFLKIFKYENHFKEVNSYMLMKNFKNKLNEFSEYADSKDISNFNKLYRTIDSDYYPGEYSNKYNEHNNITGKKFKGLPTRIYYGLSMQWNNINDWESIIGGKIKNNITPNKTKLEYFIYASENIKNKYLKKLSKKMNCNVSEIIGLFEDICSVEEKIPDNLNKQYFLRALYLYIFLNKRESDIRTNSTGNPFKKIVRIGNNIQGYTSTETDGTFLSEVYDSYNKSMRDIKKKEKAKKKQIKKLKTIRSSRPNEVNGKLTNIKNNSIINKFSPMSKTYNNNFPYLKD